MAVGQENSPRIIEVADGDARGLIDALAAGESGRRTVITLARNGNYTLPEHQRKIVLRGKMLIDGNGATISMPSSTPVDSTDFVDAITFKIPRDATVRFQNLAFEGNFLGAPWIDIRGHMAMQNVSISGLLRYGFTGFTHAGIRYSGRLIDLPSKQSFLRLENVTIVLKGQNIGGPLPFYRILFIPSGSAVLRHVTLLAESPVQFPALWLAYSRGEIPLSGVRVANSLIISPESACITGWPTPEFISLGGNLSNDPNCGFEKTVSNVGFDGFGDNGGPIPTLALRADSPAIDFGDPQYCLATDARGFEREAPCDSGAFEFGAAPAGSELDQIGFSGYWYKRGTQGFLALTRPDAERILLVWSTFDDQGQAATVYGVGEFVDDDTIVADPAYRDLAAPGTNPPQIEPVEWGELRFDLETCLTGHFSYETNQSGFSSGETELNRLTYIKGIGCTQQGE